MAQNKYLDSIGLSKFFENITNMFAKKNHTHTKSQITDFAHNHDDIYYTESEIDSKLDKKSNVGHDHDDRYYTETEIDAKLSGKSDVGHTHAVDDALSDTSTNPVQNKVVNTALSAKVPTTRSVNGKALSSDITLSASDVGASATGHTHDERYYTESEIDTKLSKKADSSHKHTADDISSVNASAITGVIAAANLPSFVDDVLDGYYNSSEDKFYKSYDSSNSTFSNEYTGESGKIYIDLIDSKTYRWTGSGYAVVSETLAIGETNTTAYRGDRGKIAYDHSQETGNPHGLTKTDLGLGNVDDTSDANKSVKYAKNAGQVKAITTTGTGAAYIASVDGITDLTSGVSFVMVPHTASTQMNPSLNVNGLGAKNIRMRLSNSSSATTALPSAGFIIANKPLRMLYDGTQWVIDDMVRPAAQALYGVVPIESGGTGASNAEKARQNLGISTANGTVLSTNADYAEVGEWADDNPDNEDRIGYFVSIDDTTAGATMVKSKSTSDVRGVTVTAPAFSSNCSEDKFDSDGNLLDKYDYVAVMGIVSVIDNGTCEVNGRCMPTDDGTAVPSPNNMGYQIIERIDATHVLIALEPEGDMMVRIKDDITDIQSDIDELQSMITTGADAPTSDTVGRIYIQVV